MLFGRLKHAYWKALGDGIWGFTAERTGDDA